MYNNQQHHELLAQLNKALDNPTQIISNGDMIYISEYSRFDFDILKYKIDDFCFNKKVNYNLVAHQELANAIIIDIDDLTRSFLLQHYIPAPGEPLPTAPPDVTEYPPYKEIVKALDLNHKIIDLKVLLNSIHEELTTIDEETYKTLNDMLSSNDPENHKLATEIITSSNRNDKTTLKYLFKIYDDFYNVLIMSGNPSTYEFLTSIERHREDKIQKELTNNDITNMKGSQIINWIMEITREELRREGKAE
jgi:hypothetical protein